MEKNKNVELKDEKLKEVSGGTKNNSSVSLIEGAIYKGNGTLAYVSKVYDNKAVSYYGVSCFNDVYKCGSIKHDTTVAAFCNNYDVENPITNVTVENKPQ